MVEVSTLNREQVRQLIDAADEPSISLYMPTHRTGKETRQDPIRLKNLIGDIDAKLESLGYGASTRDELLAPVRQLPDEVTDEFWRNGSDGLAVLLNRSAAKCFKLPMEVPEVAMASDQFFISPLLKYLQGDGHYFVLAVSQNDVRMMSGNKHGLHEIDVESLPKDLRSALRIDEYQTHLQFHSHSASTSSRDKEAIFHGQGGGEGQDRKSNLLQFFHRIDEPLSKFLGDERAPLVFAGVDYLFPIFKEACRYKHLVDKAFTGSPDDLSADDLHKPTWELVEPQFEAEIEKRVEQYGLAASRDMATDDPEEILKAARQGQIETLMIIDDALVTATGDQDDPSEHFARLATICSETLRTDGEVYVCDQRQMPTDSPVAAIYRFKT